MALLHVLVFLVSLLNLASALPASGPVNSEDVPLDLPKNETELYPPYTYKAPKYVPNIRESTPMKINASVKPWEVKPGPKVAAKKLAPLDSCSLSPSQPSTFWYEKIAHNGVSPFIPNGSKWKVFRNVVSDYGADSSGNSDSQAAFQKAINDGGATGFSRNTNSLGTTGQPAVVYVPSGTYVINSPIQFYLGTVLIGNPINPPTIKAGPNFNGDTLVIGRDSHPQFDQTTNFYLGIKNVILDTKNIDPSTKFTALDWSVSQATQLTNVVINMPNFSKGHTGVAVNGGSGTYMGDLTFNGGAVGIAMSSQQYEIKTATFSGCTTGILINNCFECVFVNMNFNFNAQGIDMSGSGGHSITLVDSSASNTGAAVKTISRSTGDGSLVIENFQAGSGLKSVVAASGQSILSGHVPDTWVYGNVYVPNGPAFGAHKTGSTFKANRSPSLLSNGKYVTIPPLTYKEYDVSQFVNVKSVAGLPVHGDGTIDDYQNLQAIISQYAGCKILFFPQGTYLVSNTLFFPKGSRIVGEAYSVISAIGSNFYNPSAPNPMIKVGNPGDVGVAQFSDLIFSVADVLQGCTLVEVNMAGNTPGDVGFWNSHFRVGGAAGSKVLTNCAGDPITCKAAFMLIHLTASSSAYIEDMWAWTADHDLDFGNSHGQNIATGRGMLIEATAGTWLHGTAVEHNTLYQYNFHNARNVFAGMQQSETPYWQGNGSPQNAPAPWTSLSSYGDPTFSNCNGNDAQCRMAWFNTIDSSSNLFIYGSGFWTFFNGQTSPSKNVCTDPACQTNACQITGSTSNLHWFSVNTRLNLNVIIDLTSGNTVTQNNNPGSWGAVIAAYLPDA